MHLTTYLVHLKSNLQALSQHKVAATGNATLNLNEDPPTDHNQVQL